jgi:hypothetical protein
MEKHMALSQEDITSLTEALKPLITEVASKAAADHVTKRNRSFKEEIDEALQTFKQTPQPPAPEPKEDTEKLTLRSLKEKGDEDLKKLREELRLEKELGKRKEMRTSLEAHLQKAGIPVNMLKAVTAQLIHEDKLIDLDKAGNPVFKVAGYNNETVTLEDGLSEWLKNDGKGFIPAPTAKGAGMKSVRSSSKGPEIDPDATQEEKDFALLQAIRR